MEGALVLATVNLLTSCVNPRLYVMIIGVNIRVGVCLCKLGLQSNVVALEL